MRYLALDLGNHIGVAISNGMFARPLEVFQRKSRVQDFEHIRALVEKHQIDVLVVGLPLNMDGTAGQQALWVEDYGSELGDTVGLPVHLWDERLTTVEASNIMHAQGKQPDKQWIDAVAAAVILQSYLDAHHDDKRS